MRKPTDETKTDTMDRRRFLIDSGRVMLVLPAGWALVSCTSNDTDNLPATTTPPTTTVTAGTLTYTSNVVNAHSHNFSILMTEVSTPPAAGISRNTSPASTDGHVHVVTLTQAQLSQINANGTVTMDTSVTENHSHTFTFSLAAATKTNTTVTAGGGTGTTTTTTPSTTTGGGGY
jgi:hypothetical protein